MNDVSAEAAAIMADEAAHRIGYEVLGRLCDDFGGRLTGSPADRGAVRRVVAELAELGIGAQREPFTMPGWVRGADSATMISPVRRRLRVAALAYSDRHPPFEADVVDLGAAGEDELAGLQTVGRIGLLASNANIPRGQVGAFAARLGLRGLLIINRESHGQLLSRTSAFSGEPSPAPLYSVTAEEGLWMRRLLQAGKPVRVRLSTRSHPARCDTANVVVRFPGRSADTVVVGAHLDSWDLGQGAIDNGLGVAQLFGIARALATHAPQNRRTVELVWFNGEEQGLWGSRHQARTYRDRPVTAMVNLDMVGFPQSVNALGCDRLVPVLERYAATLPPERLINGVESINWFASDHTPFQLEGIGCITYGGRIEPDALRHYHDFGDTFDKVDPNMIIESTATIAALVHHLANEPRLTTRRMSPAQTEKMFARFGLADDVRLQGWSLGTVPA